MLIHRSLTTVLPLFVLFIMGHAGWAGDPPTAAMPQRDPLQTILDRIRVHAANQDWRKQGWKDEKIEAWLDALVADIAETAENPTLKTPMRLSATAPVTFRRYSANKPPIRFSDEQVNLVGERPTGVLICKNLKASALR